MAPTTYNPTATGNQPPGEAIPKIGKSLKLDGSIGIENADSDAITAAFKQAAIDRQNAVSATVNPEGLAACIKAYMKVVTLRPEFRMGRALFHPASGGFWKFAYFPNTSDEARQRLQAGNYGFTQLQTSLDRAGLGASLEVSATPVVETPEETA